MYSLFILKYYLVSLLWKLEHWLDRDGFTNQKAWCEYRLDISWSSNNLNRWSQSIWIHLIYPKVLYLWKQRRAGELNMLAEGSEERCMKKPHYYRYGFNYDNFYSIIILSFYFNICIDNLDLVLFYEAIVNWVLIPDLPMLAVITTIIVKAKRRVQILIVWWFFCYFFNNFYIL